MIALESILSYVTANSLIVLSAMSVRLALTEQIMTSISAKLYTKLLKQISKVLSSRVKSHRVCQRGCGCGCGETSIIKSILM
jgi:hypothetical protein